jgi:ABC-type glutathione transport system ATPase component
VVVAIRVPAGTLIAVTAAWPRGVSDVAISSGLNVLFAFPGILLAIVGESGAGKTTIARMLVGLEQATSGTMTACGHDRSRRPRSTPERRRRGREVQIVFQDPYTSLDPRQSAESAINEVLKLHHRWPVGRRRPRVAELTGLVGLDSRQSRALPRSLSGGQRNGSRSPARSPPGPRH